MKVESEREVAQSGLTLSDSMDCIPPGPSIHGTCQARELEWGAIAFSRSHDYKAQIGILLISESKKRELAIDQKLALHICCLATVFLLLVHYIHLHIEPLLLSKMIILGTLNKIFKKIFCLCYKSEECRFFKL